MKATLRHGVQALLVLLAVLAPLSVQAERKLLDQVVAIVDEDVILQTELEARISTITSRLSAQGTALPPRQILEERVLDQLITESIQMQMADRAGMRISDNELNETMANIAERNGMSLAQFENQLAAEGVSYNQAREQIRREMLTSRVQQRQVGNRVRVTDREVENYLESLEARGGNNAQYRLAYILSALMIRPTRRRSMRPGKRPSVCAMRLPAAVISARWLLPSPMPVMPWKAAIWAGVPKASCRLSLPRWCRSCRWVNRRKFLKTTAASTWLWSWINAGASSSN